MSLREEFVGAFGVWEEAEPFLSLMFSEEEMRLVVGLQAGPLAADGAAAMLGIPLEEAAALLDRCYRRSILDKVAGEGADAYAAGSFYSFLNYFAQYENWDDIPPENRTAIDRRFLAEFMGKHRSNIDLKMQGIEPENALPNDVVLLLDEVEEMLRAADLITVQPCDCRRLGQNCDRPVEVCIWMDDLAAAALDRGHGRILETDQAVDLARWADKKGLMHTGDIEWRTRGLHAICNCCACDCYPFRAGQELGSKGVWPRSRYIAVHDAELCNLCGACVKRCHFDAFYEDGALVTIDGKAKANVAYDPEKCWGCGLCANTCPSQAIVMERLDP